MPRVARALVVPLLACLLLGAVPAPDEKVDPLKGWGQLVDPDRDCKASVDGGTLTLTVPGKHHDLTYVDGTSKLNAPRLLQRVDGDFTLEVRVSPFPLPKKGDTSSGQHCFTSGGLLIWQDDKNFVRLDRAAEGNAGTEFLWLERFKDGKAVTQKLHGFANKATTLGVTRKGDQFTFTATQADEGGAAAWSHAEAMDLPRGVQVGVHAINSTATEFAPRFEGFKLKQK